MSNEEIRRLLGGYATNTLTESERSALFEAALEDQELFNALQQEEALKSALAVPETRAAIRQALESRPSGSTSWWRTRWFAWGGAAGALAAGGILFAVFHQSPEMKVASRVEIASSQKAPNPTALPPAVEEASKDQKAPPAVGTPTPEAASPSLQSPQTAQRAMLAQNSASPAPASPTAPAAIPPSVQAEATQSFRQQEQGSGTVAQTGQVRDRIALARPAAVIAGSLTSRVLRYSLFKSGASGGQFAPASDSDLRAGDRVRFRVSSVEPGRLTLLRLDPAGEAQPLAGLEVQANTEYAFPDTPITVLATPQRFRLSLAPAAQQAKAALSDAEAKKTVVPGGAPAVVEITIAGKPER